MKKELPVDSFFIAYILSLLMEDYGYTCCLEEPLLTSPGNYVTVDKVNSREFFASVF
jgi:hypothetical protein